MPHEQAPELPTTRSQRARAGILETASRLFYAKGVRAVGMEEIVAESGAAKTTIYRHFPGKDDLVAAFLRREDEEFWHDWNHIIGELQSREAIDALCDWIGSRVQRDGYRGCPQINAAAEFADAGHPSRAVARRHKEEMHRRLSLLCRDLGVADPTKTAMQIALLFDGAFMSGGRLEDMNASAILRDAVSRLLDQRR